MRPRRPLIIAHRGASAVAPESSEAAIREAVLAGADMIELDVQMTRDGRLVVFHDERLDRTTDGSGVVAKMRYAQIARLDAGRWFHPRFAGERVLPLSQALRLIPGRMRINLELKAVAARAALLRRFIRIVRRAGVQKRLLVSSFDPGLLRRLGDTGLARALICRDQPARALRTAARLGCEAWHPADALVTSRRVVQAHAAGLRVHVWTVDEIRRARQLIRRGVDGIFTNDPARLVERLRR